MGNLQFIMIAPPDKHKDFVSEINKWKYSIEGKYFKGTQSPVVSEVKIYDVRIPEEIEERFIRDLGVYPIDKGAMPSVITSRKTKLFSWLYRTFLKLTPWKPLIPAKGEKEYKLASWYYVIPIGKLTRKKVKTELGTEREVL